MNLTQKKYNKYALVREMMETPRIIRSFRHDVTLPFLPAFKGKKGLMLTGEGSSRLFPAWRAIYSSLKKEYLMPVITEGCTQSLEYRLNDYVVFATSNSGQTKEVIRLIDALKKKKHDALFGLTANHDTILEKMAQRTHVLSCGKENAVAATKSVVEQALFYDSLMRNLRGEKMAGLRKLSDQAEQVLTTPVDRKITTMMKNAGMVWFAGRNNGVAAELTLKTNEITRKNSTFLEGTFALHGIEEVMHKDDVLVWVNPFRYDHDKFMECIVKGAGVNVIAIAEEKTIFPTIVIPNGGEYAEYLQLLAGWNLLVETGIALGIDLDKPVRARKVGNLYEAGKK